MVAFVRLNPGTIGIDPSTRVLKAADYAAAAEAEEILADARARAREITERAEKEFETQKARGWAEGLEAAHAEVAEQVLTIVTRSVDYLATAEGEVAETVLLCLRRILGEFPEEEMVLRQARVALSAVRNEPRVMLRVNPDLEAGLRERVGEILRGNGEVSFLEVVGDERLGRGGCRLETEAGVVDASIEIQIAALEKVIRARVARRQTHADAGPQTADAPAAERPEDEG